MKRSIGITCMILGLLLLLCAGALYLMNAQEAKQAQRSAEKYLPKVIEAIRQRQEPIADPSGVGDQLDSEPAKPSDLIIDPDFYSTEMTVVEIDGYSFVGYLSVPSMELQLPVMAESNDTLLKITPCRFSGSTKTDDLVIGGHNYAQHFGQLPDLKNGSIVTFTDMDGVQTSYELITLEVLEPDQVEDLTSGEYPLSLFTCTYGGASRITLRFDIVKD